MAVLEQTQPSDRNGDPRAAASPQVGDLFARRYQLTAELGRGGFGVVFEAHDTSLMRAVAIKILSRGARDPVAVARFLQEARTAASIASDHVVCVHEIGVAPDGTPFIVMERLRGADLEDELAERGPLAVADAVELVLEAALGLAHAHARGVVHRDLKPRNLFLARGLDGRAAVKVLDFGVARWASSELTESGAAMGTARYMAPEQLRSARAVDARADIWSLGVVLYELSTGAPIFDAQTPVEFAAQILVEPHVPAGERRADLPDGFGALIDRCLAKAPAARFADLGALTAALAAFVAPDNPLPARVALVLAAAGPDAVAAPPTAVEVGRAGPGSTAPAATAGALAHGSATRALTGAPAGLVRRGRRTELALAAVALLALVGAAWAWRGQRTGPGLVGAALVLERLVAAPAPARAPAAVGSAPAVTAHVEPTAPPPPTSPAGPAPIRAATPPTPRPGAAAPSAREAQRIYEWCLNAESARPTFLAAGAEGPLTYTCGTISRLGCRRIITGCRDQAITEQEKVLCRNFLGGLRRQTICR